MARPTKLTRKLGAEICRKICEKLSLRQIEALEGMPDKSTILDWVWREGEPYEWFADQYARALKIRAMLWAEECIDIADDGTNDWMERENKDGSTYDVVNSEAINRSRLRVDTRKFLMAKALPKIYGDQGDMANTTQPQKTQLVFGKGDTRLSKQAILPDVKDGTND